MPARLIVYPLFFILKDFLIAALLAKMKTPKRLGIGFFSIGMIASVSELAGYWFIQFFSRELTAMRYWDNFPAVLAGFAVSVALCALSLLVLLLIKKQFSKETAVFIPAVLAACAPYVFLLPMDDKMLYSMILLLLLVFLIPFSVSVVITNIVYRIYKQRRLQNQLTDFRRKEVKWSCIAKMTGWTLVFVVLFFGSFHAIWNKKNHIEISLFWQLAPFFLAVIVHFIYLSETIFEIRDSSQKRNLIWLALLTVLNAPYSILLPVLSRFINLKPFFAWLGINTMPFFTWLGV